MTETISPTRRPPQTSDQPRPQGAARPFPPDLSARAYAAGIALCSAAVATFVLVQVHAWPPHEDETLALFTGRHSFGDVLRIVLGRRGGAPLHFVLAFLVAHVGGGLTALRLFSALFAVASVPVVGALGTRLGGRAAGLGAAALASGSWALLFHGVYGRMYSLFLFTSALSYLLLERALEGGGRRWAWWALAVLATIATHPYGALVLASQGLYVLLRRVRLADLRVPRREARLADLAGVAAPDLRPAVLQHARGASARPAGAARAARSGRGGRRAARPRRCGSRVGRPQDSASLRRRAVRTGRGARGGLGLAGPDGAAARRPLRLRPALPRRLGAERRAHEDGRSARRPEARALRPPRGAETARPRRLGLRRERHEQLHAEAHHPAPASAARLGLRGAGLGAVPRHPEPRADPHAATLPPGVEGRPARRPVALHRGRRRQRRHRRPGAQAPRPRPLASRRSSSWTSSR